MKKSGSINQDQSGIAHLLLLLIIVTVIGAVSFVGYKTWEQRPSEEVSRVKDNHKKQDLVKPISLKLLSGIVSEAPASYGSTSTQSTISDAVSFATPDDWRPDADVTAEGCGIVHCLGQSSIVPTAEDTDQAGQNDYFVVTVSAFKTDQDAKTIFATNWQDADKAAVDAYSAFVTNAGVKGFKYDFAYSGTDAQGKYTEHVAYGISDGKKVAILDVTYFNGSHKSFTNIKNTDYGQYAAKVEQIAKTLHLIR